MDILNQQYRWIQRTREVLFDYCETLSPEDYVKESESFGGASIRSLHAHAADCYQFWLGSFALKESPVGIKAETVHNVQEMRTVFLETNHVVEKFMNEFRGEWDRSISGTVPWHDELIIVSPLWLFTHTTTHEFHHKGQIVSLSRQLGYIPKDTDLVIP